MPFTAPPVTFVRRVGIDAPLLQVLEAGLYDWTRLVNVQSFAASPPIVWMIPLTVAAAKAIRAVGMDAFVAHCADASRQNPSNTSATIAATGIAREAAR